MPIYDLVCPKCDNEWEGFSSVDNKDKLLCSSCGAYGVTQITCKSAPEIYGHYDPGLNSYVKSKKHESQLKKEKNLEELSPKETISTTHLITRENDKRRKLANDIIDNA
tara:strand:- start:626 stop:952 length:327 start_codon:yes stop_codon:yes gene_type:complete